MNFVLILSLYANAGYGVTVGITSPQDIRFTTMAACVKAGETLKRQHSREGRVDVQYSCVRPS